MLKSFVAATIALLAVLTFSPILCAQTATPTQPGEGGAWGQGKWNNLPPTGDRTNPAFYAGKKSGPAPRRDLSGIWDGTASGGVAAAGAPEHPATYPKDTPGSEAERKRLRGRQKTEEGIANPVPYTPEGEKALERNLPSGQSVRAVPSVLSNAPVNICDPAGFPYMVLYELRTIQLVQTPNHILYLNQFHNNWRVIWTDGRELPKDPKPRWDGYSVGHWVDDYTLAVETIGMKEQTWLDHAGRPHSKDLKVTEIFHRVDEDRIEYTMTIDDPKMYTEPWMGLNKYLLYRQPQDFDIRDMSCSASEIGIYNKLVGEENKLVGEEANPASR